MSALPQGWYPDPLGRFQQRYWDGDEWTARVRTGDVQQTDPMGTSMSIPFATPASAFPDDEQARRRRRRWILIGVFVLIDVAILVTIALVVW